MKQKKHLISKSVAALSVLAVAPYAAGINTPELPKAHAATFQNGTGTVDDPYLITTPTQLQAMKNNLSAHYKLANDIELSGVTWIPIGTAGTGTQFTGSFDGNGYHIKNLNLTPLAKTSTGFFGETKNATIKNIVFDKPIITNKGEYQVNNTGVLIGYSLGDTIENVSLLDIDIKGNGNYINQVVGGLIGEGRKLKLSNVYVSGKMTGGQNTGALIGQGYWGVDISNVVTDVDVTGTEGVGGLIGLYFATSSADTAIIRNVVTYGNVIADKKAAGVIGQATQVDMKNIFAYGRISDTGKYNATDTRVGGIIGVYDSSTDIWNLKNIFAFNEFVGSKYTSKYAGKAFGWKATKGTSSNIVALETIQGNAQGDYITLTATADESMEKDFYDGLGGLDFDKEWGIKEGVSTPYLLFAASHLGMSPDTPTNLEAPKNLTATATAYNEVELTFDPVLNAKEYIIKRDGIEVTRTTDTSYVDANVNERTSYKYEVIAINDGGESQPATATVTTPRLNHAPVANTIPNQTLKMTDNPMTLDVAQYFTDPDGDNLTYSIKNVSNDNVTTSINGSNVTFTPNKVGSATVTLLATDPHGLSVEKTFDVQVKDQSLVAPTNLVAKATAYNEVQLSFNTVSNAKEYIIKRDGKEIARITGTSYTDNNVKGNTSYKYEVIAVNDSGNSNPASTSVTTPINYHSVTFNWPAVENATGYRIYRDGKLVGETDETSYTDTKAEDGKTYQYKVVSVTSDGTESLSKDMEVVVSGDSNHDVELTEDNSNGSGGSEDNQTPKVLNVTATKADNTSLLVTWNPFEYKGITSERYRVQRYIKQEDGTFTKDGAARSVTSEELSVTGLKEGKTYKFEVIPMYGGTYNEEYAGTSNEILLKSSADNGTSVPEVPPVKSILHVEMKNTNANLTWDSIKDASNYRVQRYIQQEDGTFVKDGAATATSEPTFSFTGLKEGVTYKFEVTPRIGYVYDASQAITATASIAVQNKTDGEENTGNPVIPNLQAVMHGKTAVISWNLAVIDQNEVTAYRIVRYVKDEVTGEYKADGLSRAVTGTSYTDTYKLIAGKTYRYEITPKIGNKYDVKNAVVISDIVNPKN